MICDVCDVSYDGCLYGLLTLSGCYCYCTYCAGQGGCDGGRPVLQDQAALGRLCAAQPQPGMYNIVYQDMLCTYYKFMCVYCTSIHIYIYIYKRHVYYVYKLMETVNLIQGHLAKTTLFPCPHPVLGKGMLSFIILIRTIIICTSIYCTLLTFILSFIFI